MIADNFPLRSSEYTTGTTKFNDYIAALNKVRFFHFYIYNYSTLSEKIVIVFLHLEFPAPMKQVFRFQYKLMFISIPRQHISTKIMYVRIKGTLHLNWNTFDSKNDFNKKYVKA